MASTTILLNGFSIIGDPQTNTNASHGGELMIHDGEAIFEPDDILVFSVENVTVDGVLTGASYITGLVVYDNGADYFSETPLYTYGCSLTSGVDISGGRNGMGDNYLQFDASSLVSADPFAPVLGEVALVSGVDILGTLASTNGPLRVDTIQDTDLNQNGEIEPGTVEPGDGQFSSDLNVLIAICFARGTLIETPDGPRHIESLAPGDLVNTLDHGPQPIRWIGSRRTDARGRNAPVRFKAGSIGNIRDLWVSQNHRMLVRGARAELLFGQPEVLVAARHLVDDDRVRIVPRPEIDYFHFLFDDHQIVFAEAAPSESLYPGRQSLDSVTEASRAEIIRLFPEIAQDSAIGRLSRYELRRHEAAALRRPA